MTINGQFTTKCKEGDRDVDWKRQISFLWDFT